MSKLIVITDPYPRTLDLIFTKKKLKELKSKYKTITAPKINKKKFYEDNIHKATFIMGQPNLDKKLLSKAKKLKAIINVESNFMDNIDYEYCFQKGIHVIATSPVFSKPVAELALGLTLSLLRDIHNSHKDFLNKTEKYGLEGNLKSSLLSEKKIGLLGYGDLAKALTPLLVPFSRNINVYDPWVPSKIIKDDGFNTISLDNPQRIIRALEICIGTNLPYSSFKGKGKRKRDFESIIVGLNGDRQKIYDRINYRVDLMVKKGLLDEAKKLHPQKSLNALQTVGYKELFLFFDGKITKEYAVEEIKKNTRRFAKRQLTWFKKNTNIMWFDFEADFSDLIKKLEKI